MNLSELRELAILYFQGNEIHVSNLLNRFISFIHAYCADLKKTEFDILYDDKTFNIVSSLFESLVGKEKEVIPLFV